jgi:hypothetical protein
MIELVYYENEIRILLILAFFFSLKNCYFVFYRENLKNDTFILKKK